MRRGRTVGVAVGVLAAGTLWPATAEAEPYEEYVRHDQSASATHVFQVRPDLRCTFSVSTDRYYEFNGEAYTGLVGTDPECQAEIHSIRTSMSYTDSDGQDGYASTLSGGPTSALSVSPMQRVNRTDHILYLDTCACSAYYSLSPK